MSDEQVNAADAEADDRVVDDDALEMAAGGLKTAPPSGGGGGGYSYNQTISL